MKSLMRNSAFDEVLEREVYQQPALMPPSPWLGRAQPGKPKLTVVASNPAPTGNALGAGRLRQGLALAAADTNRRRVDRGDSARAARTSRVWNGALPEVVAVTAVDRNGELSAPSVLQARSSAR